MKSLNNYKKIFIFNPAFLGDTILTTPLIRLLGKLYPKAEIFFCIRPEHKDLFQKLDILTAVITFDKRKTHKGIFGLLSFRNILKKYKFDLIVDLHRSLRSTILCSLLGGRVIGFKSAVLSFLFTNRVLRDMAIHEVERNLMAAEPLCENFTLQEAKKIGGNLTCFIDFPLVSKAKHFYAASSGGKKIVGIAPGSVWNTKKYLPEYFASVATTLKSYGYAIALFGSTDDKDATDTFQKYYKGSFYDFAGKTSLKQLPAFLSSIDLLIVNDSGAMHIAIASGTPCIAIFGPTVKELGFFPYDNRSIVVENNNLNCRPCSLHGGKKCPLGHFLCMRDITPDTVSLAALKILKDAK